MSKLTQASRNQTCICCGAPDAYSCHYNGQRQHQYGKGRGIKCNNMATAEFCHNCDQDFSEGSMGLWTTKDERSESFLHFCMLTNIRRFKEGGLKL